MLAALRRLDGGGTSPASTSPALLQSAWNSGYFSDNCSSLPAEPHIDRPKESLAAVSLYSQRDPTPTPQAGNRLLFATVKGISTHWAAFKASPTSGVTFQSGSSIYSTAPTSSI